MFISFSLHEYFIMALTGLLAGIVNALAGGGTFISFPALLSVGVPPVLANATNNVALWPVSLTSAWAGRQYLRDNPWQLLLMSLIAGAGGVAGGLLLLQTSNQTFRALVPWLLLFATLMFAFSPYIRQILAQAKLAQNDAHSTSGRIFQFVVSLYGGFFGAGMGIIMIAALAILGVADVHRITALKNLLSAVIYSVAVVTFIAADAVSWPHAIVMGIAASFGGYLGIWLSQRISSELLRKLIVAIGLGLSIYYFAHG